MVVFWKKAEIVDDKTEQKKTIPVLRYYSVFNANQIADLKALVADLNDGKVDWLIILNSNPVYDAPADLEFRAQLVGAAARQIYGDLRAQSVSGRWQYHPIGDAGRVHAVLRPYRAER